MRAQVHVGGGRLELPARPVPAVGPGELLLRMRGCGLCGSDLAKLRPDGPAPAVLGHEVVGEVVEVGPGPARAHPGDRVVVAHHVPCLSCHFCRRGSPSMCVAFKQSHLDPGGFAELVRVPAANATHAMFVLPDAMADETASFTEPLACCLRAVRRAAVTPGDVALVVGLGTIGCLLAQGLVLAGARVLGWDVRGDRRALGRDIGAEVPDGEGELEDRLRIASGGRGPDLVALTAGGAAAVGWAAERVRDGGAVHCFAGGDGEPIPVPLDALYRRELTVTATYSSSPADLARAFDLLRRGAVRVDGFVTHRVPLAELPRGVELARQQRAVKVYVTP